MEGAGPEVGADHCLWTVSINSCRVGMLSASSLCSVNQALAEVVGAGAAGTSVCPPRSTAALALPSNGLNKAGGKSPIQAGLSGAAPSSSDKSASLISPSSETGMGCGANDLGTSPLSPLDTSPSVEEIEEAQ